MNCYQIHGAKFKARLCAHKRPTMLQTNGEACLCRCGKEASQVCSDGKPGASRNCSHMPQQRRRFSCERRPGLPHTLGCLYLSVSLLQACNWYAAIVVCTQALAFTLWKKSQFNDAVKLFHEIEDSRSQGSWHQVSHISTSVHIMLQIKASG